MIYSKFQHPVINIHYHLAKRIQMGMKTTKAIFIRKIRMNKSSISPINPNIPSGIMSYGSRIQNIVTKINLSKKPLRMNRSQNWMLNMYRPSLRTMQGNYCMILIKDRLSSNLMLQLSTFSFISEASGLKFQSGVNEENIVVIYFLHNGHYILKRVLQYREKIQGQQKECPHVPATQNCLGYYKQIEHCISLNIRGLPIQRSLLWCPKMKMLILFIINRICQRQQQMKNTRAKVIGAKARNTSIPIAYIELQQIFVRLRVQEKQKS